MKFNYKPNNSLEKFGVKVYNLLVDTFPQTFFVGGVVRDLLLDNRIFDIDMATSALPDEVVKILSAANIIADLKYKQFGTVIAKQGNTHLEITTLRKDLQAKSRYNKVAFISNQKIDSQRRDFTINSLYLSLKKAEILDFQKGLADIKKKQIKFIGNPVTKINQDPLRIIRALRFALTLNFKLGDKTRKAIINNLDYIQKITKTKTEKEINKITDAKKRKILIKVINNQKLLDKYFK